MTLILTTCAVFGLTVSEAKTVEGGTCAVHRHCSRRGVQTNVRVCSPFLQPSVQTIGRVFLYLGRGISAY